MAFETGAISLEAIRNFISRSGAETLDSARDYVHTNAPSYNIPAGLTATGDVASSDFRGITLTTPSPTPAPVSTPSPTPAPVSTPSPTPSPTPNPTPAPVTPNPTPSPTPAPVTPPPTPNPTPAPVSTPSPTPNPTPSPTPNPTPSPTPAPVTPPPTPSPTPAPVTPPPTPSPTPAPVTPNPTPSPTPNPTPSPTPAPVSCTEYDVRSQSGGSGCTVSASCCNGSTQSFNVFPGDDITICATSVSLVSGDCNVSNTGISCTDSCGI